MNTDELEREFRIMEWKEVDFDAQSVWVKEGSRDVFYAEPVGCSRAWTSASCTTLDASRLSIGARSGSGRDGEQVAQQIARRL